MAAATDPAGLLGVLCEKSTERKLLLFALATLTFEMAKDTNREYRQRMEVTSRYADGSVPLNVLRQHWGGGEGTWPENARHWATQIAVGEAADDPGGPETVRTLLRDIFGNPFRPVTAEPAWLTSLVVQLAAGIYAERAFDRLPILADALQDAGCDNADVLDHCRGPGPHVRGCWVIDLLLRKT